MTKFSELKTIDELYPDREPARCEKCGEVLPDELPSKLCRLGYCYELYCPCGHEFASFGPVGCPLCSPYRSPSLQRTRDLYSRRHRRGPRWR